MPASAYINFDTPGQVPATSRRLHVALSAALDLPSGMSSERAVQFLTLAHYPIHSFGGVKPYSLGELSRPEPTFGVEVCFLGNRLVDTLDAWLSWDSAMRLGTGADGDTVLVAVEGQVTAQESWEELVERDGDTTWEIRLVTPTIFSSKGQHVPGLNPATTTTSLQQRWWAWNRGPTPLRTNRYEIASVLATQDYTRSSMVLLAVPRDSGQGCLNSCHIPAHEGHLCINDVEGTETTRISSRLMTLSTYTNVGSHAGYGIDVIDAVAT